MTVTTLTLAAFLEARLAKDEESAPFVFAEQFTPARVLAEVAAKRAILGLRHEVSLVEVLMKDQSHTGAVEMHMDVLRHLAAAYSDHPDYDESWRP